MTAALMAAVPEAFCRAGSRVLLTTDLRRHSAALIERATLRWPIRGAFPRTTVWMHHGHIAPLWENPGMQSPREWAAPGGYVVSTDPVRLDVDRIYRFLSTAYWSTGIPRNVVERSIANSLPFGLYSPSGEQAGFARVVTDRATYAYLGDVYVEAAHRGRGLGKFLVSCVVAHPELQGLRRWALATADAHDLYARHGFRPPANPEIHLFIERAPADLWPARAERNRTCLPQATQD